MQLTAPLDTPIGRLWTVVSPAGLVAISRGELAIGMTEAEVLAATESCYLDRRDELEPGWYWQDAPVETQALMIEAFSEIERPGVSEDAQGKKVDELKSSNPSFSTSFLKKINKKS